MSDQHITACCEAPVEREVIEDNGEGFGFTACPQCGQRAQAYAEADPDNIDERDEDYASESEIYHAEHSYEASRLR